jgi:hypothetical protein
MAGPAPSGFSPSTVASAYGFSAIKLPGGSTADGNGQTIAIVDAYDDPNIGSDLKAFDQQFSLPDPTFTKLNQSGQQGSYPSTDSGWSVEIALDVEWAHAIAPGAGIVLVEANSANLNDLMTAVKTAAGQASVVSMSWGGGEFSGETGSQYDGVFAKFGSQSGGVTFVAASGDSHGVSWPASSPNVVAVGGTTLSVTSSGASAVYASETAWRSSGGGVSRVEPLPSYQKNAFGTSFGSRRTTPDVAYDASLGSGFAVYDTVPGQGFTGWVKVGGTSAGSPQWAALIALADQGRAQKSLPPLNSQTTLTNLVYGLAYTEYAPNAPSPYFHDVTGYPAGTGYDLYTGLGSPVANTLVPYTWGQAAGQSSASAAARVSSPTSPSGSSQTPAPSPPVTVKRSAVVIIVSGPSTAAAVVPPAIVFVPVAPAPVPAPATAPASPSAPTAATTALVPVAQPLSRPSTGSLLSEPLAEPVSPVPPEFLAEPGLIPGREGLPVLPAPAPNPENAPAPAPGPDAGSPPVELWDDAVAACVEPAGDVAALAAPGVAPPALLPASDADVDAGQPASKAETLLAAGAAFAAWGAWEVRSRPKGARHRRLFDLA